MTISVEPHVRSVRVDDHTSVRRLAPELLTGMSLWRTRAGQEAAVSAWINSALAEAEEDGQAVFVASLTAAAGESNEELVGFVHVAERTHFAGDREAYVGELVVAPARRRHGVGRSLMAAAEDWARRRGLSIISLETGSNNTVGRALYADLGYEEEQVTLTKCLG